MRFEELKNIILSWNPRSYRKKIVVKKKVIFLRSFFGILLSLFLMLLVSLPLLINLPQVIEEKSVLFDELSVNVSITTNQEIEVSKIPRVIINTAKENLTKEKVLINDKGLIINKHFGKEDKVYAWTSLDSANDLLSAHSRDVQIIILLLIPSVLIALLVIAMLEGLFLVCVSLLLSKIICLISRRQISISALLKITSLALIPFFMLQIIPFMYIRWWSIPLLTYVLIITSAIYFVSEGKEEFPRKKPSKNEKSKKRKHSHEILFSEDTAE